MFNMSIYGAESAVAKFVCQILSFEKSDFHEINYKPGELVGAARVWMAFEPGIQALFPIHRRTLLPSLGSPLA